MADTPNGETVTPGDSQTTVPTSAPATGNAVDQAEVERLRKEAAQATMRANQLQKEKEARDKADAEKEEQRLKEKEDYKTLADQTQAKLDEVNREREEEKRQSELKAATSQVFSDYPQEVIEIAEDTGLSLSDASDEAKAVLKEKLDKIKAKVRTDKPVTPSNPNLPNTNGVYDRAAALEQARYGDKDARYQVINNIHAVQEMRKMAGIE